MKRKKRLFLFNSLAQKMDIPEEGISGVPVMEVHGMSSVLITGCRTIQSYEETLIGVNTDLGLLEVHGSGLTIHTFAGDRITVEGHVSALRFAEDTSC